MSLESQRVSGSEWGSLQVCLVGGDPEQRSRERSVRRRSLVISIATQSGIVAAIVLLPLLAKPARIAATIMPIPPYYSHGAQRAADRPVTQIHRPRPFDPRMFDPGVYRRPVNIVSDPRPDSGPDPIPGELEGPPGFKGTDGIPLVDTRVPSQPSLPHVETPRKVHVTQLDPAMLIHRVEPIYPVLMKQIGRAGQVQLRAIIGTDGSVQSLQVVSGDPGFYQSALEAVRQWRYRATVLNGTPVEVDTFITVIYNIAR
jgi:TonB family protein